MMKRLARERGRKEGRGEGRKENKETVLELEIGALAIVFLLLHPIIV